MKMNLFQAMAVLNENRPNRPKSLDRKKLQQAIDAVNDYAENIPWEFSHRCEECEYHRMIESKLHPYQAKYIGYCDAHDGKLPEANMTSCGMFVPKEEKNEKNI